MRVVVAVTAASGAIYARQVLDLLVGDSSVDQVALIYSRSAREVAEYEGVELPMSGGKVVEFSNDDMFASVASGSSGWDSMVIVPCSVATVGRIASGVSDTLITRVADVMLKERRRLVVVLREMPLSLIHLRNLTTLTEAGGVVLPASPNFYMGVSDVESLAMTVSGRALSLVGLEGHILRWEGKKGDK